MHSLADVPIILSYTCTWNFWIYWYWRQLCLNSNLNRIWIFIVFSFVFCPLEYLSFYHSRQSMCFVFFTLTSFSILSFRSSIPYLLLLSLSCDPTHQLLHLSHHNFIFDFILYRSAPSSINYFILLLLLLSIFVIMDLRNACDILYLTCSIYIKDVLFCYYNDYHLPIHSALPILCSFL